VNALSKIKNFFAMLAAAVSLFISARVQGMNLYIAHKTCSRILLKVPLLQNFKV
jgi:hypothetical protein